MEHSASPGRGETGRGESAAAVTRIDAAPRPRRRAIVIGASNVARGIATLVNAARDVWDEPLDLLLAGGHGRSLGMTTCVLGRWLPGVLQCGLWDQLASRESLPTAALVTDLGNDLVYGADAARTAIWLQRCLRRLSLVCDRIVVTELPLASLQRVGPRRYRVLRRLMFPRSRLTYEGARSEIASLNERVARLADEYGAVLQRPSSSWYGVDPIHIRRRCLPSAWRELLAAWHPREQVLPPRRSNALGLQLRWQRPLYRRWLGSEQRRAQPSCILADGTVISLY